eukprot:gnl/TRDRNA2_/TRDRNA2_167973_c0_seq2.p1 gnl/TRDRNA2_/TRDRNA2_167973_c0~~gnl/TRDRNA2_/TRDRNA2_167973_c0_seq2.p1  ORF type:complete len:167 (-),score=22.82 gnl/TRDRNA2_/TRDRNA2_167973_c0_seq2:78-578(-)
MGCGIFKPREWVFLFEYNNQWTRFNDDMQGKLQKQIVEATVSQFKERFRIAWQGPEQAEGSPKSYWEVHFNWSPSGGIIQSPPETEGWEMEGQPPMSCPNMKLAFWVGKEGDAIKKLRGEDILSAHHGKVEKVLNALSEGGGTGGGSSSGNATSSAMTKHEFASYR